MGGYYDLGGTIACLVKLVFLRLCGNSDNSFLFQTIRDNEAAAGNGCYSSACRVEQFRSGNIAELCIVGVNR